MKEMNTQEVQSKARDLLKLQDGRENIWPQMHTADSAVLSAFIAMLGRTGTIGAADDAVRDAAMALLQARISDDLIAMMERLNRSATVLSVVGIVVAVVIGIGQILVPILIRR